MLGVMIVVSCNSNKGRENPKNKENIKYIENIDYCKSCNNFGKLQMAIKHPDSVSSLYLWNINNTFIDSIPLFNNLEKIKITDSRPIDIRLLFSGLCLVKRLRSISFQNCSISILPPNIGCLKHLKELYIEDTLYNISNEFYELRALQKLSLNVTHISDSLKFLQNLKELTLHVIGQKSLPLVVTELKNLEVLYLTEETNSLPAEIGKLRKLRKLDITRSPLAKSEFQFLQKHHRFNQLQKVIDKLPDCKIIMNGNVWN